MIHEYKINKAMLETILEFLAFDFYYIDGGRLIICSFSEL
jgi:hypothetical protein